MSQISLDNWWKEALLCRKARMPLLPSLLAVFRMHYLHHLPLFLMNAVFPLILKWNVLIRMRRLRRNVWREKWRNCQWCQPDRKGRLHTHKGIVNWWKVSLMASLSSWGHQAAILWSCLYSQNRVTHRLLWALQCHVLWRLWWTDTKGFIRSHGSSHLEDLWPGSCSLYF